MQPPDLPPDLKGDHLTTVNEALTLKQQAVRDFIETYRQREGVSPSLREIQAHFGFASPNAAAKHLSALRRKGVVQRSAGRARGLVLSESSNRLISEIPILGAIPAGHPLGESEQREGCVRVDLDTLGIPKNARTFALKVRGDSMTGAHILDGDIVILELKSPSHGRVVAALIDGESTLKTFLVRAGKSYLRAENPNYPDLIPAHELVIQGVMVALLRQAGS
jgi:repressor LexA